MPDDILQTLDLAPDDLVQLTRRLRQQLLQFLLRWKYLHALQRCLAVLLPFHESHVSFLDLQAELLLEQGLHDAAWEVIQRRVAMRPSVAAHALAVRILLARGDGAGALALAERVAAQSPDVQQAIALLGSTRAARGDYEGALAAYRRLNEQSPNNRTYLLGMCKLYQMQGDWVTASAFAVQLQESQQGEGTLSPYYLHPLLAYYEVSHETNRAEDVRTQLELGRAASVKAMRSQVHAELEGPGAVEENEPGDLPGAHPEAGVPQQSLHSHESVVVPDSERERLVREVRRVFGHPNLLPGQAEILSCAMNGEDILAILPTGGGKSLCYQLPALLAKRGVTLVISPLIALMKDQIDKLPGAWSRFATTINSSLSGDELNARLQHVKNGSYRLVYAAPERLRQPPFLHALRQADVNRLVIDEAHCVSMWGHDFRPDYLYVGEARRQLGTPPLLAMTATAAPRVRADILARLGQLRIIAGDPVRNNLRLEVFHARSTDEKLHRLCELCRQEAGDGIVYAATRMRCEQLAEMLRRQGVEAVHYHAGISNRDEVQDQFMNGEVRVIVATVAFGMGIDKRDIRFIIHFEPPPSLEAYYQEAGRAGRDGRLARCMLLYAPADKGTLTRRSNYHAIPEALVRDAYASIQRRLSGRIGRIAVDDLRRDLQAEDTTVRVAVHILEQIGVLRRWPDIPRTMTLRLLDGNGDEDGLNSFCAAAHLRPRSLVTREPLALAEQTHEDPRSLEETLLRWAEQGQIEYRASARDLMLELPRVEGNMRRRLQTLLEQYEKVRAQRKAEIVAYARTRHCRHGHISAYLGGRAIRACNSCDNCGSALPEPMATLKQPLDDAPAMVRQVSPKARQQYRAILSCLSATHPWGRQTLAHTLHGSNQAPPAARETSHWGALSSLSQEAIVKMIDALLLHGFLQLRVFDCLKTVEPTLSGYEAIQQPQQLDALPADIEHWDAMPRELDGPRKSPRPREQRVGEEHIMPDDLSAQERQLFERLRQWRLARARADGVPPYIVAHDAVLCRIARHCPHGAQEMLAIRGIGQVRYDKYGAEWLRIIAEEASNGNE